MYCKYCGAKIDDDSQFCAGCGRKTETTDNTKYDFERGKFQAKTPPKQIKICSSCGAELADDALACGKCGAVVGDNDFLNADTAGTASKGSKGKQPKRILIIAAAVAAVCVLCFVGYTAFNNFSGTGSDNLSEMYCGQWETASGELVYPFNDSIEIFSDGTFVSGADQFYGTYSADGSTITFTADNNQYEVFSYTAGSTGLTLTDELGSVLVFNRAGGTSVYIDNSEKTMKNLLGEWEIMAESASAPFGEITFYLPDENDKILFPNAEYIFITNGPFYGDFSVDGSRIRLNGTTGSPFTATFLLEGDLLIFTDDDGNSWSYIRD